MTSKRAVPKWLAVMVVGLMLFATVTTFFNPAQAAPSSSPPSNPQAQPVTQAGQGNTGATTGSKPAGQAINSVLAHPANAPAPPTAPPALSAPQLPDVVLYDQYNNDGNNAIVSSVRSDNPSLSAQAADDFVITGTQSWSINEVDARGYPGIPAQGTFNVSFYTSTGTLPGTPVYSATNLTSVSASPDYTIPLTSPATLTPGAYWVSVTANQNGSNWYWGMRSVLSNNPAAWREGGGYGTGCTNWSNRGTCTGTTNVPDQMYRLLGTVGPNATSTPTTTATPCAGGGNVVVNGGFETGTLPPWIADGAIPPPAVVMTQAHSGTFSALLGNLTGPPEPTGDSSIYQTVAVPAGGGTLSYWYWPHTRDSLTFDWQDAYVVSTTGTILATIMHVAQNTQAWTNVTFNMAPYAGQTVRIKFLVHQDGFGDETAMYVDDVSLTAPGACGTPTTTATPSGATATPTQCAGGGYKILIAYSDNAAPPNTLRTALLAQPGVTTVGLFDAFAGTPTVAQMQQYDEVVTFSNNAYADANAMGNNLADYQDSGGVVVVSFGALYNDSGFGLTGRWLSGGYSPTTPSTTVVGTATTLGVYSATHPLMQGVTTLNSAIRIGSPLAAGATQVATYTDGTLAVAYKATAGHTAVALPNYMGDSGGNGTVPGYDRVIVNALRWLKPAACGTPTVTATPSGATATPTQCAGGNLSAWSFVANYSTVIESPAVASNGTYAYSAGGAISGSATNATARYDPVANIWVTEAPLPTAYYDARAIYDPINNKIYVMGGYNGSALTNNNIYDIASNTWSSGAPLPAARVFPSLGFYNGKIYLAAGFDSSFTEQTAVWQYDPVANTWVSTGFASDPAAQGGAATAQLGQYLYLMGGYGGSASSFNERYDMAANTWATMAPLPAARYDGVGAGLGGKAYVVGGGNPANNADRRSAILNGSPASPDAYNTTLVYDPGANTWGSGPNLNTPRSFPGGNVMGNSILMVGGFNGSADTNTVEKASITACGTPTVTATPSGATATPTQCVGGVGTWQTVAPGPLDLYGAAGTADAVGAYFGGGYSFSGGGETPQFARYNVGSNVWTTLAPMTPNGAVEMASANYSPTNNKVYVMGGGTAAGTVYNTNRIYDVGTNTWTTGAPMPDVRGFAASGYFNGNIYIVGGYTTGSITPAYTQTWQYNIAANTWTTKTGVPAPLGFGGAGSTVINGHLYVAGGRDSSNTVINTLWDYNIATDSWTQRANMPAADNVPGAATLNGKLYVFGGGNPFNN
ncbi:MAG: hypothetical protein DLM69_12040, partial [Candidatus Chloroheliales bacterium]